VVVELRGFEPLTPCMPLMCGWFTSPCTTSPTHATEQVKGAAEGWVVGRRQVTCSAVSGKSLARVPAWSSFANAGATVSAALDHLRLGTSGALLSSNDYGSSVERTATLHPLWQVLEWEELRATRWCAQAGVACLAKALGTARTRSDRGLVWLNILYLLPLCLLPFGAKLLGRYGQEPVALRIYGLVLVAIAVMRVVIWLYATNRPHLLWQRLDDRQRRAGLALNLYPGLVYLLAFLVAKIAPGLSLLIYGAMPVLYFLSITVLRSGRKGNQEYADFT
jgi:hypothetical protein